MVQGMTGNSGDRKRQWVDAAARKFFSHNQSDFIQLAVDASLKKISSAENIVKDDLKKSLISTYKEYHATGKISQRAINNLYAYSFSYLVLFTFNIFFKIHDIS